MSCAADRGLQCIGLLLPFFVLVFLVFLVLTISEAVRMIDRMFVSFHSRLLHARLPLSLPHGKATTDCYMVHARVIAANLRLPWHKDRGGPDALGK